jgi:protein involved in polysaccharide export with SLBB domain
MTAAQLVRLAGGLKRSAYLDSADLARYVVQGGKRILGEHQEIAIGKALSGEADTDVRLFDGDVLTVRQLAGWADIGSAVTLSGEVAHPGTYGIHDGERLSSLLERAGGFRPSAYPYGAVLERVQVRDIAENTRQELIHRLENVQAFGATGVSAASAAGEQMALFQAQQQQRQQVLAALKSQPASGRMVVHITQDVRQWKGTAADIEVRAGDALFIPKRPNFVLVTGQVNSSSAITYSPGRNAGWYLQQAGGLTEMANKKGIFVVRADGSIVAGGGGFWKSGPLSIRMQPGDTVVVPSKIIGGSMFWKNMLNTAQVMSSLAITAGVVNSF